MEAGVSKAIKSVAGAIALAVTAASAVSTIVPVAAYAQTTQASALASAITNAANTVKGEGPAAAAAREKAVQDAIDSFLSQNGVDPAVAASLISAAMAAVSPSVAGQPGVQAAASAETAAAQTRATQQAGSPTSTNAGSTTSTNTGSTGTGSTNSGISGGGGGYNGNK